MDKLTITALCDLNTRFYRDFGTSFSDTRNNSWPGWERVLSDAVGADVVGAGVAGSGAADAVCVQASSGVGAPIQVLDIACGNMRFERFAQQWAASTGYGVAESAQVLAQQPVFAFTAVDNSYGCDDPAITFIHDDVMARLLAGDDFSSYCDGGFVGRNGLDNCDGGARAHAQTAFDLTVAFGFFHHVPSQKLRALALQSMIQTVKPGGKVALSLWRFADDDDLRAKAQASTKRAREYFVQLDFAQLEAGDYILGWQNEAEAFRYCHSFTDEEIDELITAVANDTPCSVTEAVTTQGCDTGAIARLVDRFESDGRTGTMNTYLVLERR